MEPSNRGGRTLEQAVVHWRSVGLVGACLAGGLTLTVMVIGAAPTIGGPVAAATEAVMAQAADTALVDDPASTEPTPDSTQVSVAPVQEPLAAPAAADAVAVPGASSTPVAWPTQPTVAGRAAPVQPVVVPSQPVTPAPSAAAPAPDAPTAPVPTAAAVTPTPTAAPPTAAPTTAAPTTAAPTTAAPAPVALSYPSYTVSGVSGVSLQFDGSSISVASVSPQANWVYEIATNGPRTVEIKFFNVATGSDREFHATVEGGQIKVET